MSRFPLFRQKYQSVFSDNWQIYVCEFSFFAKFMKSSLYFRVAKKETATVVFKSFCNDGGSIFVI